jgi:hypothetical protein
MLESLEGRRGEVRVRPPLPAIKGLFGQPTVVNNVVTLATVPVVLSQGARFYQDFGVGRSRGTIPLQLAGNVKRGGLVERAFGLTVNQLVYDYGGGSATGRPVRAVQIGGPLGAYLPESEFDTPLEYEALAAKNALLGHGGVVGVRRQRRHGADGALCARVLRGRILRQMHAMPHRLDARGRAGGSHTGRQWHARRRPGAARRTVRHDVQRVAVRARWHDAVSRAQRLEALPQRFSGKSLKGDIPGY